jgi:hypothetical protein
MAEQSEVYEKILTANLQRAIDFLRFAEAKNAALLALASAWVLAAINLECSGHTLPSPFTLCVPIAMLLSLFAGVLALWSFLPRLHLPSFLGGKKAGPHPKNLLYFGDIHALTIKSLKHELHSRYYPDATGYREEYLYDLVVQLKVNSDIAMRKMLFFRVGICLILLASLSLAIPALPIAAKVIKNLW